MMRAVTRGYDSLDEADEALEQVSAQMESVDLAVLSNSPGGRIRLQKFDLPDETRRECEQVLDRSGFLFVAKAPDEETAERVRCILSSSGPASQAASSPFAPARKAVDEQRIPLLEEELRVGKRQVVRGGARVRTQIIETPVHEEVELTSEETSVERRPVNRRLTEEEIADAGLLQERVIEVSAMREEAVVQKETFVREELIVRKSVEQRIERIDETLRRTEATVEQLPAEVREQAEREIGVGANRPA